MKKLFTAGLAALAALALAPHSASAQEVTLRLHTFLPPVANPVKHFLTPWADKVTKASKGRMKVQVYPSMQLGGKAPQLLNQVRDGVVDIVWTLPGFTPGVMPKLEIFELPFLHRDTHSTVMALQEYVEKHMKKEFEPYHVILVNAHAGALFMTKDPIAKVDDFKGMKLRSYSRTNAWILEALGATPLQLPLPELVPMMSKGTVSGSILPFEIAPAVKMHELADHFTTLGPPQARLSTAILTTLLNKKKYDSLPADLKAILRYAAEAASSSNWWTAMDNYSRDFGALGTTDKVNITRTPKSIFEAQMKAWDVINKKLSDEDPFFKRVVESQKAWSKRVAKYMFYNEADYKVGYEHIHGKLGF